MSRIGGFATTFLRTARLAVVRSNVPPLSAVYEALYRWAAWLMVRLMRARFPSHLEAVFLRGSLAMELLVPALSDIDLFVVLRDAVSPEEHERLKVFYRRWARWLPVLDPYPWILRWGEVQKLYGGNPSLRFRIMEGRQAFLRIYGLDRLADLPEPAPDEVAVAQLFDLKSRLTYFNAFCLTRTFTDELEARRKEYLLFKLTVELARITLFLTTGRSIFQRRQVIRSFLGCDVAVEGFLGLGDDQLLRDFVAYTARFRLRRSFCRARGMTLETLEARLLHACLELCAVLYARQAIPTLCGLAFEREHFYSGDRFLPVGHAVRYVHEAGVANYVWLKAHVLEGNAKGIDTTVRYRNLLINLSNADPQLGNCTVVLWE